MNALLKFYRHLWKQPFQGEIYEYAKKIRLQAGYAIKGNFDVEKSRYLIEPFRALKNPRIRAVVVMAGIQTGKSLLNDLFVPYCIEHDPGELLWLFQKDEAAKIYADERFMLLLNSINEIKEILDRQNKNDKRKTSIVFPNMSLDMCGLSAGNVQTMSRRYVIVDEAWLAGNSGLIEQAEGRTTAFPHNSKFIITSQAGIEGDDLDIQHSRTNQNEWCWKCPSCSKFQPYAWSARRDDNSWAGILWDDNERTRPGGKWRLSQVLPTVRMACLYCAEIITDTPANRRKLDDGGQHIPQNSEALPTRVGFRWPSMANPSIAFATLAEEYISAKAQFDDFGYKLPLMKFHQQRLARPWSENQGVEIATLKSEPYDPNSEYPDEVLRAMVIDCQKDFTRLYVLICAWTQAGHVRELYWGMLENFDQCEEKQKEFKVKDQHTFVDLGYEQTRVAAECVKHGHFGMIKNRKMWLCWTGLKGSDTEQFNHTVPKYAPDGRVERDKDGKPVYTKERRIYSPCEYLNPNIGRGAKTVLCPSYVWSNLNAKDIAKRYRDGKAGKVEWLPDTEPKTNLESATNQMHSEYRARVQNEKTGKKVNRWLRIGKRPNHKWDAWGMQIIVANIYGIIGSPSLSTESETKPEADPH